MAASKKLRTTLLCCVVLLAATGIEAVKRRRGEGPSNRRVQRPSPGAATKFINSVESKVTRALKLPRSTTGESNMEIAEVVREIILTEVQPDDPQKRAELPNYGFDFSVVVWNAQVQHPYEALITADTVIQGPTKAYIIKGGMTTNQQCYGLNSNHVENSQGWPCRAGGSAVVQGGPLNSPENEKNCMVFFLPRLPLQQQGDINSPPSKVAMFHLVSEECLMRYNVQPMDLTNVAYCVFSEWGSQWARQKLREQGYRKVAIGLKGVAVVPCYSVDLQDVGFVAPSGRLLLYQSNTLGEELGGGGVWLALIGAPSQAKW